MYLSEFYQGTKRLFIIYRPFLKDFFRRELIFKASYGFSALSVTCFELHLFCKKAPAEAFVYDGESAMKDFFAVAAEKNATVISVKMTDGGIGQITEWLQEIASCGTAVFRDFGEKQPDENSYVPLVNVYTENRIAAFCGIICLISAGPHFSFDKAGDFLLEKQPEYLPGHIDQALIFFRPFIQDVLAKKTIKSAARLLKELTVFENGLIWLPCPFTPGVKEVLDLMIKKDPYLKNLFKEAFAVSPQSVQDYWKNFSDLF
jgi:hypothetical protein